MHRVAWEEGTLGDEWEEAWADKFVELCYCSQIDSRWPPKCALLGDDYATYQEPCTSDVCETPEATTMPWKKFRRSFGLKKGKSDYFGGN